jgi:hypothetical protein
MTNIPAPIYNSEDVIDSRDVIARIEHLQQLRHPGPVDLGPEDNATDQDSLFAELATLEALAEEAASCSPDWEYGEALIRDSYFKEYAMELAEDIGAIDPKATWPNNCIDWDRAVRELQMDYTAVDFDGVTYWLR